MSAIEEFSEKLRTQAIAHEAALAAGAAVKASAADAERRKDTERVASEALANGRAEEAVAEQAAVTARNAQRAVALRQLLANSKPDSLGAGLRVAIARRENARDTLGDARAEAERAREEVAAAQSVVDGYAGLDAERDTRAVAAFRAGSLGEDDPDLLATLAARDAATARLDAAQRAERVLSAAVGEAHAASLNADEAAVLAATAVVASEADRYAAALEEAEQRAAVLRTVLMSADGLWLTAPGVGAPIALPLTDRQRRLLSNPPANTLARRDPAIVEAFKGHFGRRCPVRDSLVTLIHGDRRTFPSNQGQ
jgi:hypothetical protein